MEYVKIAIDGLNFELRKKFEGITFIDLFELSERVSRFEGLLKEENQRKKKFMRPTTKILIMRLIWQNM